MLRHAIPDPCPVGSCVNDPSSGRFRSPGRLGSDPYAPHQECIDSTPDLGNASSQVRILPSPQVGAGLHELVRALTAIVRSLGPFGMPVAFSSRLGEA
jgi:hypothetical protein